MGRQNAALTTKVTLLRFLLNFSTFLHFLHTALKLSMLLCGDERVRPQETQSQQRDADLLTEIQAQEQELPMSLAWYRRKRVFGGGPPFIRVSNRIFYCRGELRRWIADHSVDCSEEGR